MMLFSRAVLLWHVFGNLVVEIKEHENIFTPDYSNLFTSFCILQADIPTDVFDRRSGFRDEKWKC